MISPDARVVMDSSAALRPPSGGRLSRGAVVRLDVPGRNPQSARFFFLRVAFARFDVERSCQA